MMRKVDTESSHCITIFPLRTMRDIQCRGARRARARCPTRFGTPRAPRPCERRWPGPARPACRRTSPAAPRRGCSRSACASAPAPAAEPAPPAPAAATAENDNHITIKSPIIGTFYRKPSPDKPNFVEAGDQVNEGDVLCVVEAMKLFNEIESEVSGTIVKVLVDDSSPVEFDQPLFIIDPS